MERPLLRRLGRDDVLNWEGMDDTPIFGGDLIDVSFGYRMSAMSWQLNAGAQAEVTIATDEAWVVIAGEITIRGDEVAFDATGRAGDVLLVPRDLPAVAKAGADTELITVAYPPFWSLDPAPDPASRAVAGETDQVRAIARQWREGDAGIRRSPVAQVGADGLAAQLFQLPADASMRLPAGPTDLDEVVVVVDGEIRVAAGQIELPVKPGQLGYRPAGQPAELHAIGDAEFVLVRAGQPPG